MSEEKSWQLGRGPGSWLYGIYDYLRHGVSRNLSSFLRLHCAHNVSRVLEAGSGPGSTSSLIARWPGLQLSVATDIDSSALNEGQRLNSELVAVAGDLYALPFSNDCFDLVWNSSTLEHLSDMPAALAEMARTCTAGGYVFVGVPNLYGPLFFQSLVSGTAVGTWIGTVFSRRSLAQIMMRAGLTPIVNHYYFFGFFVGILARKN